MLKKEIRKIYSAKRQELSPDRFLSDSQRILDLFREINLNKAKVLLSYVPLRDRLEFNVSLCEKVLLASNHTLLCAHPRIMEDGLNMEAITIHPDSEYLSNRYNIAEPQGGNVVDPLSIDVVFLPLLAFDEKGYRVGYGKGYYDRFLKRCRKEVLKIGFSFFGPVVSIGDIDQFDVPLSLCITPLRVYEF